MPSVRYRDPTDVRGHTSHFDGIQVMGLTKHHYKTGIWFELQWKRLYCLLKGDHAGAVEGRSKCKRKSDDLGIAEFDGQSALTYFDGQFFVYARANPQESGYRTVQVCHGPLDALSPFELCNFRGVPDASDIYFLHPYVVPGGRWLVAIMSLVWPEARRNGFRVSTWNLSCCVKRRRHFPGTSVTTCLSITSTINVAPMIFQSKVMFLSQRVKFRFMSIEMFRAEWHLGI